MTVNTYRIIAISKIWWSVYLAFSVLMVSLFIYFLCVADLSEFWLPAVFMLPVSVALGVLAVLSLKHLSMRLTISESIIYYKDIFRTRQFEFQKIKGFRLVSTAQKSDIGLPGWEVEIESKEGVVITVPKSIEKQELLIKFLKSEFENLDVDQMKTYSKSK